MHRLWQQLAQDNINRMTNLSKTFFVEYYISFMSIECQTCKCKLRPLCDERGVSTIELSDAVDDDDVTDNDDSM